MVGTGVSDLRGRGRPLPPQLACPSGSEDRAAPSFECAVSASASFPVRAARLLLVSSKPSFAQVEAITRPWPLAGTQTRWRRRFNGFHAGPHGSRAAQDSHRGTPEGFQGLMLLKGDRPWPGARDQGCPVRGASREATPNGLAGSCAGPGADGRRQSHLGSPHEPGGWDPNAWSGSGVRSCLSAPLHCRPSVCSSPSGRDGS